MTSHISLNEHRLNDPLNGLEARFLNYWKECQKGRLLEYILSSDNTPAVLTDRDEKVAATVIQWLGSPVGRSFLRNVLEEGDL